MRATGTAVAVSTLESEALRRCSHGQAFTERCPLGTDRTLVAAPQAAPLPLPRSQAPGLSEDPHRNHLCAQDRHQLGGPARRTGLGLRQDLPILPQALA